MSTARQITDDWPKSTDEYEGLKDTLTEPYDWDHEGVKQFDKLFVKILAGDWLDILNWHIRRGNSKMSSSIFSFSMNSATECPNLNTEHCQVPDGECYAFKSERRYENTNSSEALDRRRRMEIIWDLIDPDTFAKAVKTLDRRRTKYDTVAVRFSVSGDFRTQRDIWKVDRIAALLSEDGISVYTYSASDWLDWSDAENFTVNQSNDHSEYGDQRYKVVEHPDEADVMCPYQQTDGEVKCGDCRLCIEPVDGIDTIGILPH